MSRLAGSSMRVALTGSRGFIGGAIRNLAQSRGWTVVTLPRLRVTMAGRQGPAAIVDAWPKQHPDETRALMQAFSTADTVINAAGLASPASPNWAALEAAN